MSTHPKRNRPVPPPGDSSGTARNPGTAPGELENGLAVSTSPYLLQHAGNPVHWQPWCADAFERARELDRPVFLSIGYAACHWCHVMERESFENPETARVLNEHFVSIKVDREERPDVDDFYMHAVLALTGSGGWPLSVFLTPDREPFFGGTYFPPSPRYGMPSFIDVITRIAETWKADRRVAGNSAERLSAAVREHLSRGVGEYGREGKKAFLNATEPAFENADRALRDDYDHQNGGFGSAPKFPSPGALHLLLRRYARTGDADAIEMVHGTLQAMARGGVFDQLGGGFHRYSTDARWLVPHFEKMLYDNAQLAEVYLQAWQATGVDLYRETATRVLDYLIDEMRDDEGGFHASEDADSPGGAEGAFYVWTHDEVTHRLGARDGPLVAEYFGATPEGNFENGHSVLHVPKSPEDFAREHGLTSENLSRRVERARKQLLAARARRERPARDDKVVAAWNGMAIAALSLGHRVLSSCTYLNAAQRAGDFILREMIHEDGTLARSWRQGRLGDAAGFLEDYAHVISALLGLFESDGDLRWLDAATRLAGTMIERFSDQNGGPLFFTAADLEDAPPERWKPLMDNVTPSGNSQAVLALVRLSILLERENLQSLAGDVLVAARPLLEGAPRGVTFMLCGLDACVGPWTEVVVVGKPDSPEAAQLLAATRRVHLPNSVSLLVGPPSGQPSPNSVQGRVPFTRGRSLVLGEAAAYVCRGRACREPAITPEDVKNLLEGDW